MRSTRAATTPRPAPAPITQSAAAERLRQAIAERCRRSFLAFCLELRPEFALQWFHLLLIDAMQQDGTSEQSTRLGISMPPGHAKTEYCCLFIAWLVARDASQQIMYVTYNQDRASEILEERIKPILEQPRYRELFGRRINSRRVVSATANGESNNKKKFRIVGGSGFVQACGFGGGITGARCDVIVIDDPFKGPDAFSPTERDHRWREYQTAVLTRKRAGRPLRILMPFTRWHLDDLCGRARASEPEAWRWIEIEALRTGDPPGDARCITYDDPREVGEALWSAVYTANELLRLKHGSPHNFNALFQQRPLPEGGELFKAEWLTQTWDVINLAIPGRFYQSWDFRHGGERHRGSYAVGLLAWVPDHEPAHVYLIDLVRERWDPAESQAQFLAMQKIPPWSMAGAKLVERKADGIGIISQCSSRVSGIIPITPTLDKVSRARNVSPYLASGCLYLPATRPWVAEFRREMTLFPQAGTDDQVDAVTQLLDYLFSATTIDTHKQAVDAWNTIMRPV